MRVVYDDGDCEDISIEELQLLVHKGANQESGCGSELECCDESIEDTN